jgi:hypothetical protein
VRKITCRHYNDKSFFGSCETDKSTTKSQAPQAGKTSSASILLSRRRSLEIGDWRFLGI